MGPPLTFTLLGLVACTLPGSAASLPAAPVPWPSRVISWWYAADNNWPNLLTQIAPYVNGSSPLVTSVQTYCGYTVSDEGTVSGSLSSACAAFFPRLTSMGVRAELCLDAGNCSIDAYRTLWQDTTTSPQVLLQAAIAANATGWNIDLEPQADNCKGGGTGTAADAQLFAAWLSAVRKVLNPYGIRLTVDAASWSPVIGQYKVLAGGVDRVQTMETYNGNSESEWEGYFDAFVDSVPVAAAGVGLGAWTDGSGAWWETPAGAQAKVAKALAAGVPELAVFRLVPTPEVNPAWPLSFWWDALKAFAAG